MQTKELYSLDAEMSILGSVLIAPDDVEMLEDIFSQLKATDFGITKNAIIFSNMLSLFNKSIGLDLVTMSETLGRGGLIDSIGGLEYLVNLTSFTPSASNYKHYMSTIKDYSNIRKVKGLVDNLSKRIESGSNSSSLNSVVEGYLNDIVDDNSTSTVKHIGDSAKAELEAIKGRIAGTLDNFGLETGFKVLDEVLNGLQKSDLIVIGARPGVGKTALAVNILDHVANTDKKQALFFSLEMAEGQIVNRILSLSGRINNHDLKMGNIDINKVEKLIQRMEGGHLSIDDNSTNTVSQMSIKAKQHQRKHGLDLVVVDYLQFVQPDNRSGNKWVDIGEIAKGLKIMAKQLNVPVIALAQVNRNIDNEERMPRLSDLSDSAEIEKNADIVMFLHPDSKSRDSDPVKQIDLYISKFRNGAKRAVRMNYIGSQFRFEEIDKPKPKQVLQGAIVVDNATLPENWL